jgi:hypothetical protein
MNDGLVVNPRAGLTDAGPCRAPLQGWGGPRSEYLDDQTSTGRHSPVHTNDQDRRTAVVQIAGALGSHRHVKEQSRFVRVTPVAPRMSRLNLLRSCPSPWDSYASVHF